MLPELDRRSLLRSAILLVGGSLAAGLPARALAGEVLAVGSVERFFTPAEFAILTEVAENIIPRTDTPGATDAKVPEMFDLLMTNWASAARKAQFRALVQQFGAAGVLSPDAAVRAAIVERIDLERFAADDQVYRKFKELVLTLYYWSEAGATQELRYELIPGKWDPSTVIDDDTRTWAA
ncbi:MAG TPA: gluconate 2-dehydrogenase subunit 3 family protein [Sphingomicrobium sp.]|nr:gluconate 2-dehydrogenase subunit 3 family protein [Sphingomicrobium sp.]